MPLDQWVDSLCDIFKKEVICYRKLLELELQKKEVIQKAEGKKLQSLVQESYHLMVESSELERVRMRAIEDYYQTTKTKPSTEQLTLTDFLNQLDRETNYAMKGLANELKTVVQKLKEAVIINDKLMKTRQELLKTTIDGLVSASGQSSISTYDDKGQSKVVHAGKRIPVLLNAKA